MFQGLIKNEIDQDDYMNFNNITILKKRLPNKTNALTFIYRDIKIVILNSLYSDINFRDFVLHELIHIELNHIYSNKPRQQCELEVEQFINKLNEKERSY